MSIADLMEETRRSEFQPGVWGDIWQKHRFPFLPSHLSLNKQALGKVQKARSPLAAKPTLAPPLGTSPARAAPLNDVPVIWSV